TLLNPSGHARPLMLRTRDGKRRFYAGSGPSRSWTYVFGFGSWTSNTYPAISSRSPLCRMARFTGSPLTPDAVDAVEVFYSRLVVYHQQAAVPLGDITGAQ